jgi:S-methylmethionine-dependent homocysteine/selenocysteine methylase
MFTHMKIWSKKTVVGVLFNCAEPESITKALQSIQSDEHLPGRLDSRGILLGAYANRFTSVPGDWSLAESQSAQPFRSDLDPNEYYDKFVSCWVHELGVRVIGGCCGITPEHIAHLSTCLRY